MISSKALQEVLDAAQVAADNGPCFCTEDDCEWEENGHGEPEEYPSHAVTFVKPNGDLDRAENKHCLGRPWGIDGPLGFVTDHPTTYTDDAPRMVIVDRATGAWCCATAYLTDR